jgi:hypothetical protein
MLDLHPTTSGPEEQECSCPVNTVVVPGAYPDVAVVSFTAHRPTCRPSETWSTASGRGT